MKKFLSVVMAVVMTASLVACSSTSTTTSTSASTSTSTSTSTEVSVSTETSTSVETQVADDVTAKSEGVMTYAEYDAAALDSAVVVECYVQDHQSWWSDKITVYAADADGAYFMYEMACSQEDAAKLVPGTKIKVTGTKSAWAGEVEIVDATFEILDGSYVAAAQDVTALYGTDELISKQNALAAFNGFVIEAVSYKNGTPGDDIYVTASKDGVAYEFCLEYYLNGSDADFYNLVGSLKAGDVVNMEGFLYWYYGANPHLTKVEVVSNVNAKSEGVMTYSEYAAAALDTDVTVEVYVQDHQSWWSDKVTVYAADADGAYFLYELACSQEDAAKLVPGTKIKVTGVKSAWAGEVEIVDATFEFVDGASYVAPAADLTGVLGTDALVDYQNQLATFKDLTVVSVAYKNDTPGDDIYVTLSKDGVNYDFCLEYYLNGSDAAFYEKVGGLTAGATVDVTGFLYWYNGVNTHITDVVVK